MVLEVTSESAWFLRDNIWYLSSEIFHKEISMNLKRLISLFTLSLFIVSTVVAQTPSSQDSTKSDKSKADEEKARETLEKKAMALLDEVLKEAPALRLAENRIRVQATAADLLWKYNEKRARALFKQAADSFAELLADEDGAASPQSGFVIDGFGVSPLGRYPGLLQARAQLRQEILQLLTNHDPKLARDFLRGTSFAANRENSHYGNENGEIEMDLNIASQVAATDPKQALQIAEEHLEKGFPYGIANVLTQLQNKDTEAAAKLVAGIMKRLRTENIATNREAATFALMLLGLESEDVDSNSDKARTVSKSQPIVDEKTNRELIDMVVTAVLSQLAQKPADSEDEYENGQPPLVASIETLMPKIEKYAPARVPALRKKIAEYESALAPQVRSNKEYQATLQKGDLQAIIDVAAKASPEIRDVLVMQAIMKVIGEGEFDRARQMIDEHVKDAGQRKMMLANMDRQILQRAVMLGKLDEARPLLSQLPTEERATVLTQFAIAAIGKGDKKLGIQFLEEARGLLGAQAANYVELDTLLQIARSYASIEPARSFDIIEPTVEQLNVLLSALASIDGFESFQLFKDGELIGGGPSVIVNTTMQCARDLARLSRADFDRAKTAADRFSRSDVRVTARLSVVQGVLSNQPPVVNLPTISRRFY